MLKKFLGIFKRDKSGFSDEELKWQLKMEQLALRILIGISAIMGFPIVWNTMELIANFIKIESFIMSFLITLPIVMMPLAIYTIIVCIIINKIGILFRYGEIKRNLKEQQTKKVSSCIKIQEFSKLTIERKMSDHLFCMLVKSGIIEVKPFGSEIKVSIPEEITKNSDNFFFIKEEELLTYFKFDKEA